MSHGLRVGEGNPPRRRLLERLRRQAPTIGQLARLAAFVVATILIFARLGHYALWDDEALTALAAQAVAKSGDTSLVVEHNVVAYRDGLLARNLHDRSTPPLSAYMAAPFVGTKSASALAARIPFALCGVLAIALILWWAGHASPAAQIAIALGIAANVSLLLYFRQCRYYAPAILLSIAVVWCYLNWSDRRHRVLLAALCSILLFAANYLNFLALHLCLVIDFFVWQRKSRPAALRAVVLYSAVTAAGCLAIAAVWNPLRTRYASVEPNSLADRLQLFAWHWRDLNSCEFGAGALLVIAAILALRNPGGWQMRGWAFLVGYVATITAVSPQVVAQTSYADIRYVAPLIPLIVVMVALTLVELGGGRPRLVVPLAVLAFFTNGLHGGWYVIGGLRSTFAEFVGELAHPPADPYRAAGEWIRTHVRSGQSVWVVPSHMAYPLMYHVPQPIYAWQLSATNRDPQFASLPAIHFQTRRVPHFIAVFGPIKRQILPNLAEWARLGVKYEHVATLNCFWQDRYRPELFLRSFKPVPVNDPEADLIYFYRLVQDWRGT